jgi:hypothetical protein
MGLRRYNTHIDNKGADMLVRDLIELLESFDADMEVHFAYNYGDHWRTEVSPKVSDVREGVVTYSEYHRMDKVADEDYDDEDEVEVENQRRVVIID